MSVCRGRLWEEIKRGLLYDKDKRYVINRAASGGDTTGDQEVRRRGHSGGGGAGGGRLAGGGGGPRPVPLPPTSAPGAA